MYSTASAEARQLLEQHRLYTASMRELVQGVAKLLPALDDCAKVCHLSRPLSLTTPQSQSLVEQINVSDGAGLGRALTKRCPGSASINSDRPEVLLIKHYGCEVSYSLVSG